MKLKSISILLLSTLVFMACNSSAKFEVSKGKVGKLNAKTQVKDIRNLFKNDSVVVNLSEGALGDNYFSDEDEYKVYEKGGKHLLTITPKEQLDSTSTIKSVEIFDERFEAESGLHLKSTFAEINLNNNISKVESTLTSATLFIDELNATLAIDKQELGLKPFSTQKVTLDQIPDLAKIKTFVIWFN